MDFNYLNGEMLADLKKNERERKVDHKIIHFIIIIIISENADRFLKTFFFIKMFYFQIILR